VWDFWSTKWHQDRCFSQSSPVTTIQSMFHTHQLI
jgi:hypothetical protein